MFARIQKNGRWVRQTGGRASQLELEGIFGGSFEEHRRKEFCTRFHNEALLGLFAFASEVNDARGSINEASDEKPLGGCLAWALGTDLIVELIGSHNVAAMSIQAKKQANSMLTMTHENFLFFSKWSIVAKFEVDKSDNCCELFSKLASFLA